MGRSYEKAMMLVVAMATFTIAAVVVGVIAGSSLLWLIIVAFCAWVWGFGTDDLRRLRREKVERGGGDGI